jgi:hypothetical protein
MVQPQVRMISSNISHMALHSVWRDSGVTQKHGFELIVDVCGFPRGDEPPIGMRERAPLLLQGRYEFISGLHHETYVYRARGDKRMIYVAQAQNDWDDRMVARPEIRSTKDLEGQKVIVADRASCVVGNLKHSLQVAGVDIDSIEFVGLGGKTGDTHHRALDLVERGEAVAANVEIPFDLQGKKRGFHELALPGLPVIHNATMCSNREWALDNEDTMIAFLKSMIDAIHFFKREKSKVCEILERSLAPTMGITSADEIEHWHAGWAKLLSPKPYPHPLAVWNVYTLEVAPDPNVNFIGPFEIWDTSYLRTIDDAGYIDELWDGAHMAKNPPVNAII